jgi:hypothetical protein
MIDSIGLGAAIANLIYLIILAIATVGGVFFLVIRKKFLSLIWLSILLNLLSFLYFMGIRNISIFSINYIIWPILNIILIVYYINSNKKAKKK